MKTFNHAAGDRAAAEGSAVSRTELERLEAQRRKPVVVRELTPEGMQAVRATQDHTLEERVRHLAERLEAVRGRAVEGFASGKTRGVAKHGFERSR